MRFNRYFFCLIMMLFSSALFAQDLPQHPITDIPDFIPAQTDVTAKKAPDGICVFDIDNTLLASTTNWSGLWPPFPKPSVNANYENIKGYNDLAMAPYVRDSIYQCVKHHYGVAFATGGSGPDAGDRIAFLNTIFNDSKAADYFSYPVAQFLRNAFLNGANGIFQYRVTYPDKSFALNNILSVYQKASSTTPIASQCVILFDNDPDVVMSIDRYNNLHKTNPFLAVLPMSDRGVTQNIFNFGVETLSSHGCKWETAV